MNLSRSLKIQNIYFHSISFHITALNAKPSCDITDTGLRKTDHFYVKRIVYALNRLMEKNMHRRK